MDTNSSNKRKIIILSTCFGFIIILALVGLVLSGRSTKKNTVSTNSYYDSFSHQTISNPLGATPETYGTNSYTPTFLGIDKFLDYGITSDQLSNLKIAFSQYSNSLPAPVKEISIDVDHISTQNNVSGDSSQYLVYFNVKFDRKNIYQARLDCSGVSAIRLYLINPSTKKTVYDSQIIDVGSQTD